MTTTATTTTARLDLLTPIHKGLRRALFETAIQLARTDFGSPEEVAAARGSVAACCEFLREHAEHEDRHTLPLIARFDPRLGAELMEDHPQLERMAIDVESVWPRLSPLEGAARAALGAELVRRFQAFVAAQIRHMDREEREAMAVLWSNLRDDELAEISRRIVASIEPERMRVWGVLLEGALSRPEREAMTRRAA